jgi:hypothetical protein
MCRIFKVGILSRLVEIGWSDGFGFSVRKLYASFGLAKRNAACGAWGRDARLRG